MKTYSNILLAMCISVLSHSVNAQQFIAGKATSEGKNPSKSDVACEMSVVSSVQCIVNNIF